MPGAPTDPTGADDARGGPSERTRLRILCLALHTPLPADNGDSIRVLGVLRALAARHETELVCIRRAATDDEHVRQLTTWLEGRLWLFDEPPPPASGLIAKYRRWARAVVVGEPPWMRQHWNPKLASFLAARDGAYDAVLFLGNQTLIYAHVFRNGAVTVADVLNVTGWSVLTARGSEPRTPARAAWSALATMVTRRWERRVIVAMEGVIVTSSEEASRLTGLYGTSPRAVIPSAIDLPPQPLRAARARTVGWLGGHEYMPNLDGLLRFVSDAWPQLGAAGCTLLIAGAKPPPAVLRLGERSDIEVLGYVADLSEFLARVDVAVVPLWAGAGVKLKTVTFMGAGIPVVSTAAGVEGTGVVDGVHALVREQPADLAAGLRRLLDDEPLAQRVAADGRALVAERLTWSSVGDEFVDVVERIVGAPTVQPAQRS